MRNITFLTNKNFVGYLFILPSICVLAVFLIAPLIAALVLSFFDYTIMLTNFEFVGFDNYLAVFNERRFWNSMRNTLYFTAVVVPVSNALSLLAAVAVCKTTRINVMFRTVFFLPVVCSMTIVAMALGMMFDFNVGIVPAAMRSLGLPVIDFLNSVQWAMPTVILITVYKVFGFNMVIFIAALQSIPAYIYEAAEIDGAGKITRFFKITLPSIAPTITFTIITSLIGSFQVFDQVFVTTGGDPMFRTETAVQLIFERAFRTFDLGFANANAFLLFIVILTFTLISRRISLNFEKHF